MSVYESPEPVIERCVPNDGRAHALMEGHHRPEVCCAEHIDTMKYKERLIVPGRWIPDDPNALDAEELHPNAPWSGFK